ncbi:MULTISPECIES: hypothetical protein [unclassified Mesorhizobium]|uniref:hypothetical protein n=1 Tax=unclassified Mesorhizobium TaxID=325217 RepID=UPI00333809AE
MPQVILAAQVLHAADQPRLNPLRGRPLHRGLRPLHLADILASLSDVALLKRLRAAADWLGDIAGALLQKACAKSTAPTGRRLRVVDGSSISRPGSAGTDWRLHATYEPALARFTHLEISDVRGGEASCVFRYAKATLLLAIAPTPALRPLKRWCRRVPTSSCARAGPVFG